MAKKLDPLISEYDTQGSAGYDAWFRANVQEALDDPRPSVSHDQVMAEVRATVAGATREPSALVPNDNCSDIGKPALPSRNIGSIPPSLRCPYPS